MGSRLVSWFNKKQSLISISTTEAEYVAIVSCCKKIIWMMKYLQYIQITCIPPISILCHNTSAIGILKNLSCIPRPSTYPLSTIFYKNKCLKKSLNSSMLPPKNMLLIYSLILFLEKHLNISAKTWE